MPTYKAPDGTEVSSVDHQGNVNEPVKFGKSGEVKIADDDQALVAALESAVAAGAIKRVAEPKAADPNRKE